MDADLKIVQPLDVSQSPASGADADRARFELEQANAQLAAALRAANAESMPHAAAGATDILRRTETKRDQLAEQNADLERTVNDLRGRVEYLEAALAGTEGSFSWRITKPLRSVKSALKR